jgi:hypothetical protein
MKEYKAAHKIYSNFPSFSGKFSMNPVKFNKTDANFWNIFMCWFNSGQN